MYVREEFVTGVITMNATYSSKTEALTRANSLDALLNICERVWGGEAKEMRATKGWSMRRDSDVTMQSSCVCRGMQGGQRKEGRQKGWSGERKAGEGMVT